MTVLPHPMSSFHRGINTSPNTSAIQPTVRTILDQARRSDQHIVRLYYLPTPNTNGFATTHTLVSSSSTTTSPISSSPTTRYAGDEDNKYPLKTTVVTRNRSVSLPYGSNSRFNHHDDHHDQDTSSDNRRISHLTRVSESDRGIVHLARLRISTMIIATSSLPYLSHLVSLRLQGNQLTDLPLEIFRLESLRELDVSQNLLTELSGLIGLLAPTLEELFLQSNRLQSLPQQIGLLKRLRLLDIADNHLGCIPVEIQRLVSESLVSERRSFWRVNEAGLSLSNILEESWTTTQGEGSTSNSAIPTEPLQHPQHTIIHSHDVPGNEVPNEEGGHDDDDYVQIRQGMKCWARGNRFWQVKATRTSTPMSPITETTTKLLAGTVSPISSTPTTSPSTPTSPSASFSVLEPSLLPLHSGTSTQSRYPSSSSSSFLNQQPLFPGSNDVRDLFNDPNPHPPQNQHRLDIFSRHRQPHHHHHHQNQQQPYPEHLVDRRGYSKDSYTSCSWTLSLADICSQIAGEKLYDDPHYFCHTNACPIKNKRRNKKRGANNPNGDEQTTTTTSTTQKVDEIQMEDCTMMMMPEWMTEQLGLFHISELRKAAQENLQDSDVDGSSDEGDGGHFGHNNSRNPHEATGDSVYGDIKGNADLFSARTKHDLLEIPPPMQLTLKEKEMLCEFCSVCQKRLYFAGMRWKGVGVMDERIVPLEWVACSVQCRARAEHGERRDHQGKANSAATKGLGSSGSSSSSSSSSSSTVSQDDGICDNNNNIDNNNSNNNNTNNNNQIGEDPSPSSSSSRVRRLADVFQSGVNSNFNHQESTGGNGSSSGSNSSSNSSSSLVYSPVQSPSILTQDVVTSSSSGLRSGARTFPYPAEREGETPIVRQQHHQSRHSHNHHNEQQLQQPQPQLQQPQPQPQRDYRETLIYGLIKSRALRRRTRSLSL